MPDDRVVWALLQTDTTRSNLKIKAYRQLLAGPLAQREIDRLAQDGPYATQERLMTRIVAASDVPTAREVMVRRPTAPREGSASPRKPK